MVARSACGLGHHVGVGGEGDVAGRFGGRGLFFGHKAVALLEGLHLEGVDPVDDAVEFVLQLRVRFNIDAAASMRSTARSNSALASGSFPLR